MRTEYRVLHRKRRELFRDLRSRRDLLPLDFLQKGLDDLKIANRSIFEDYNNKYMEGIAVLRETEYNEEKILEYEKKLSDLEKQRNVEYQNLLEQVKRESIQRRIIQNPRPETDR